MKEHPVPILDSLCKTNIFLISLRNIILGVNIRSVFVRCFYIMNTLEKFKKKCRNILFEKYLVLCMSIKNSLIKKNQSTESAHRSGCLKFYGPLEMSPFSVFFWWKNPFWCLVFSRTTTWVTLFTEHCRFGVFYWSIHTNILLSIIKLLFLQKFEVFFGFVYLFTKHQCVYKANMFECRI